MMDTVVQEMMFVVLLIPFKGCYGPPVVDPDIGRLDLHLNRNVKLHPYTIDHAMKSAIYLRQRTYQRVVTIVITHPFPL